MAEFIENVAISSRKSFSFLCSIALLRFAVLLFRTAWWMMRFTVSLFRALGHGLAYFNTPRRCDAPSQACPMVRGPTASPRQRSRCRCTDWGSAHDPRRSHAAPGSNPAQPRRRVSPWSLPVVILPVGRTPAGHELPLNRDARTWSSDAFAHLPNEDNPRTHLHSCRMRTGMDLGAQPEHGAHRKPRRLEARGGSTPR